MERWSQSYALWLQGVYQWRVGNASAAVPLLRDGIELGRPVNDEIGLAFCVEGLAWCAAAMGRFTEAATLLGAAYAVCKRSGAADSHSAIHRFAHDEVEAQVRNELGEDAYRKAYEAGARCTSDEAVALALGKQPRAEEAKVADTDEGPFGVLTRREAEIANLVAAGMTNREIATTLVIAPRTAEGHVENILAKLGFTSRAQIATWTTQHQPRRTSDAPAATPGRRAPRS